MFKKAVTQKVYALATTTVFPAQPRVNLHELLTARLARINLDGAVFTQGTEKISYSKRAGD
jgi:hypothetical protein